MSKSKMDKTLNDRITKWILEFSQSELDWDSYHIDEFQECKIPKSMSCPEIC